MCEPVKVFVSPLDYSVGKDTDFSLSWTSGNTWRAALTSYVPNFKVFGKTLPNGEGRMAGWDKGTLAGNPKMGTVTDGLSNTLFVAEKLMVQGDVARGFLNYANTPAGISGNFGVSIWGANHVQPQFLAQFAGNDKNGSVGNDGPWLVPQVVPTPAAANYERVQALTFGGCLVALGDGSVRTVAPGVDEAAWSAAITPNRGEAVSLP